MVLTQTQTQAQKRLTPPRSLEGNDHHDRPCEERIRSRLRSDGLYAHYLRDVRFSLSDGTLTLHGQVPTVALRWKAESMLENIDGIQSIINRVDVISARGLSSVHHSR